MPVVILQYEFERDTFNYEVNHKLPTNDEGDLTEEQIGMLSRKHVDEAYQEYLDKKLFEKNPYTYYGI